MSPSDQVLPSATAGAAFLSQQLLCLGELGLLSWEDSGSYLGVPLALDHVFWLVTEGVLKNSLCFDPASQ